MLEIELERPDQMGDRERLEMKRLNRVNISLGNSFRFGLSRWLCGES